MPRKELPSSPRRLKALQRSKDAITLRLAGYTYQQIGDKLGITKKGAEKALKREMLSIQVDVSEKQEQFRELQNARLDAMLSGIYLAAVSGKDLNAIDRVLRIEERRAKLFGLDATPKQELPGGPVEVKIIGGLPD